MFAALPSNAALTEAQLRSYVRNTWQLTSLTDDTISQYLDTSYEGIPFKDWIEGAVAAGQVAQELNQGDFSEAAKTAAQYGAELGFDSLLQQAGLLGVASVARLAAWPIELSLNQFVDAVKKKSFRDQAGLYFAARAHNSAERIRNAQPYELLNANTSAGAVYKTDEGWLIVHTCYFFCSIRVLGYSSPDNFYEYAELLWQAKIHSDQLASEQRELAGQFLLAATPSAPTILAQPQSRTIIEGQSATFAVSASGTAPITYQWRFNGAALPGAESATLTATQPGLYQAEVSNAAGTVASRSATLIVLSAQSVQLTAPAAGATISGPVLVSANVRNATRVEFWIDGQRRATDSATPFAWTWDTTGAADGDHSLVAKAYSGQTLLGATSSRAVTVMNSGSADPCFDPTEPNDGSTVATVLPLGGSTNAWICSPADVDWFRVTVNAPGQLNLDLTVPTGKDFDLELFGPDGLWLAGSYLEAGRNESIQEQATVPGDYLVRVYGYPVGNGAFSHTETYQLGVSATEIRPPDPLSGPITNAVIWSGVVEPTGDVTILSGGSLKILPGTQVRCAGGDDRASGADSSRVEIILNGGTLDASGAPDALIRFTSRAQNPTPGNWYGLRVIEGGVTLSNCVVEYAVDGVRFEDGDTRFNSYSLGNVTVQRCSGSGVWTTSGQFAAVTLNNFQLWTNGTGLSANGPVTLVGGQVVGNIGHGISGNSATLVATGTIMSRNGAHGVNNNFGGATLTGCVVTNNQSAGAVAYYGSLNMAGCTVMNNSGEGVYLVQSVLNMSACTVSRNNGWGVNQSQGGGSAEIWNSVVQSNGSGGLVFASATVGVVGNTISGNSGIGLQLVNPGVSASGIRGNVITGNGGVGITLSGGGPSPTTISGNDIYQNTNFELRNDSSTTIIANGNYWGNPTGTELSQGQKNLSRIYDILDGGSQQVLILNWYPALLSSGNPGTLQNFAYNLPGVTQVSGTIDSAQTWSGTVLVTGDVTVSGSLTIAAGTTVRFDSLHDAQASGNDRSRCELIVNGSLNAAGTPGDPIRFTSSATTKNPGDWYGIRVVQGDVTLTNCVVEYATEGIRFENANTQSRNYALGDVTVQRCSGSGVWTTSGQFAAVTLNNFQLWTNGTGLSANGPVTLVGGQVVGNIGHGISGNSATLVATGTIMSRNGAHGVNNNFGGATLTGCVVTNNQSAGAVAYYGSLNMAGCTVMNNSGEGVYLVQSVLNMSACTVSRNNGWGVNQSQGGGSAEIWNSVVQSNGSGGLVFASATVGVVGNTISGNSGVGLQLANFGVSASGITGNAIWGNGGVGIALSGGGPSPTTISGNDIYQNTGFELRNDSGIAIVAPDNYWGEPTTTEWTAGQVNLSRIFDQRDNPSYGQVLILTLRGTAALQAPRFTTQPQSVSALPGESVELSASASGSDPITYQWYRNGSPVTQATAPDLALANLNASKAGSYFIVAANAAGRTTSAVAQVTLIQPPAPPVIVQHPVSQTVALGGSVSFAVAATGTGPFNYQWRKNSAPISGASSATFSIASVLVSDAAEYTVTVSNPGGNATSQPATLTVNTLGGTIVTRQITQTGTNFFVTVTIIPPVGTPVYLVEEFVPAGFTARDISNSGSLDALNGRVVWGPFWDGLTRTLAYTLVPPAGFTGTTTLNGAALFFGATAATDGDNLLSLRPTGQPARLSLTRVSGIFAISVAGEVGRSYRLEARDSLTSGQWEPLATIALTTSPRLYIDGDSIGQPVRFYRCVLVE